MGKKVSVNNGYNLAEVYDERLSIQEVEKQRKQYNFNAGDIMILKDMEVKYPALLDENGKPITEKDKNGNIVTVRDFSKRPYFQFYKYGIGKKSIANIKEQEFVEMLENLSLHNEKAQEILRHCFPKEIIDYGSFVEEGDRALNLDSIGYLKDSGISVRSLPLLDESQNPLHSVFYWVDDKGAEHSIQIYWYAGTQSKGCRLGIKK
jgi:hypothetical protein